MISDADLDDLAANVDKDIQELVAEVRMLRALLETQAEVTTSVRAVDLALRHPQIREDARTIKAAIDADQIIPHRAALRLLMALGWDE